MPFEWKPASHHQNDSNPIPTILSPPFTHDFHRRPALCRQPFPFGLGCRRAGMPRSVGRRHNLSPRIRHIFYGNCICNLQKMMIATFRWLFHPSSISHLCIAIPAGSIPSITSCSVGKRLAACSCAPGMCAAPASQQ